MEPNEFDPAPNMLPGCVFGVLAPDPAPKLILGAALPAPNEKGVADDWLALLSAGALEPNVKDEGAELASLAVWGNGLLKDVCPPPAPNVNEEVALPPNIGAVDCVLFCC